MILDVPVRCRCCNTVTTFQLPRNAYKLWTERVLTVQDAFPELTAAQRHLLSEGTCGACFLTMYGHPNDEIIDTEKVSVLVRETKENPLSVVEVETTYSDNAQPLVHILLNERVLYHPDIFATTGISVDVLLTLDEWKPEWGRKNASKFLAEHSRVLQDNMLHAAVESLTTLLRQWEGPDPRTYEDLSNEQT